MNKIGSGSLGNGSLANDCCVKEVSPFHQQIVNLRDMTTYLEEAFHELYEKIYDSGMLLQYNEDKCESKAEKESPMCNMEYELSIVTNRLCSIKNRIYNLKSEYRG